MQRRSHVTQHPRSRQAAKERSISSRCMKEKPYISVNITLSFHHRSHMRYSIHLLPRLSLRPCASLTLCGQATRVDMPFNFLHHCTIVHPSTPLQIHQPLHASDSTQEHGVFPGQLCSFLRQSRHFRLYCALPRQGDQGPSHDALQSVHSIQQGPLARLAFPGACLTKDFCSSVH